MHGNHQIMGNYFYTKYSFIQNNIMYQTQDRVKQTGRQTDERRAITTIHAYYSQICVNSIKYFWQTGCSIIVNKDASLSQIPDTFDDYFRNTLKVRVIYCLPRHWPCIFGAVWTTISFLIIHSVLVFCYWTCIRLTMKRKTSIVWELNGLLCTIMVSTAIINLQCCPKPIYFWPLFRT